MNGEEGSCNVSSPWQWLDANWQYAGLIAALFYLASLTLLNTNWTLPDVLLWLQLPIYVVHQLEEHIHDRFRRYVNTHLGHGQPVLTSRAVTIINIGGVWCVDFIALYLVKLHWTGGALIAFYLAIVNAVIHLGGALASRSYNPGLVTAAVLLLPLGVWGALTYSTAYTLPARDHLTALALTVALHLVIIVHVMYRRTHLAHAS